MSIQLPSVEEALETLSWLVSMNTVSSQGATWCQDEIAERLHQFTPHVHLCDFGSGQNLIAHFGEKKTGGIMLAGHVDVVPAANQNWTGDPFRPCVRDGRIYGRGTTDMKGFVACTLASAPVFTSRAEKCPVTICLTPDEETAFDGARALPAQLKATGISPCGVIVGEPTQMTAGTSHPGFIDMESDFCGISAHASLQELGANAIYAASEFVTRLAKLDGQSASKGTRISVGCIKGGSARNIVAETCTVDWEIRHATASPATTLLNAIAGIAPFNRVSRCDLTINSVAGLSSDHNRQLALQLHKLAVPASPKPLLFATEAGIYQSAGLPSIVCGPGSIEQAHKPDEFLELSQLVSCLEFIGRIQDIQL